MKRIAIYLSAVGLGLLLAVQTAHAFWGSAGYGGYQPWWNIFAKKPHMSVEEERLQRFWHDYYASLESYYGHLDHLDWVSYYKNHGYQINTGGPMGYGGGGGYGGAGGANGPSGGSNRIQFAPVFVGPQMQWAVPNSNLTGPASGPPNGAPSGAYTGGYGPGSGGGPMSPMPMPGGGMGGYPPPANYPPAGYGGYPPAGYGASYSPAGYGMNPYAPPGYGYGGYPSGN